LAEAVLKAADLLSSQLRTAQETEAGLMKAEAEQQKNASELGQKSIEYNGLTHEMESNRSMYQSVLNNLKQTDVSKQWNQTPIRIVEPAFAYGPIRPKKSLIISATATGGFMLGLAIALGLSVMDTSLKTVDEAEKLLRLPALAAVPRRKLKTNSKRVPLPMLDDPKGSVAEAFRSLRANLSLLGRQEQRRTFLFTSAHPSEGKTFTCCNYAIVSAQMGVRTLLIDADLRRPAISQIFFGQTKKPGLADCLSGQASVQNAVLPSEVANLSILPAGSTVPNPAELLSSAEFAAVVKEAMLLYDRVIVDTAPVNAVSDTLMLAPHVQTICLVVRAGSTHGRSVMRAIKILTDIQCKPAGIVLNYLPEHRGIGYYYYYYSGE
jgi:capsular exopolysaccharide synthesis family protein